jgi:hypothetical protein
MMHARGEKYKIAKYEEKRPLKISMHTWEDNIKMHPKKEIRIWTIEMRTEDELL